MIPAALVASKVAAVLAAAAAAALVARRQPARVRAALWCAAAVAAVAMPLLDRVAPPVAVVVPSWLAPAPTSAPPAEEPSAGQAVGVPATSRTGLSTPAGAAPASPGRTPVALWLVVWLTGLAVVGVRELAAHGAMARMLAASWRPEGRRWRRAMSLAAHRSGCARPVELLLSDRVGVPVTAGLVRPVIVLPAHAGAWCDERVEVVLTHELIHVRRRDWAARLASRLLRTVHWYDPLAWWAAARLETEQERAVDDEVVARGVPRSRYAAHLLATARGAARLGLLPAPALGATRRPRLEDRIMSILETEGRPRRPGVVALAAASSVLLLVPVIAAVQPGARVASPELADAMRDMRALEDRLEPFTDRITGIEGEMAPHLEGIGEIEIELDSEAMAAIEAEMAPLQERLEAIAHEMEPLQDELLEVGEAIRSLEVGRLSEIDAALEPHLAELDTLHERLEPFLAQIEEVHREMEPLHARMEEIHRAAEPARREAERIHARIEPFQRRLEEVQHEMEPLLEEVERAADRVERAVVSEIGRAVREQLGSVTTPGAPFAEAAGRIVDLGRIRVDDDLLRLDADRDDVRDLLADLMSPHRTGTVDGFEAALDAGADALSRYRVSLPTD